MLYGYRYRDCYRDGNAATTIYHLLQLMFSMIFYGYYKNHDVYIPPNEKFHYMLNQRCLGSPFENTNRSMKSHHSA